MARKEEIKEKAEKFADALSDGLYFKNGQLHKCREHGFIEGAKWADQTMIEKACEWLKENIYHRVYGCGDKLGFPTADFLADFKKAMEE